MFFTILTQPLLNILLFFVWLVPGNDLGVAIILLTITLRLVLYPLTIFAARSQGAMQRIQPQLNAIKAKHKDSKEKQFEAMMALYRQEGVSPVSMLLGNFVLLAVQLPILIAMFRLFHNGVTQELTSALYSFMPQVSHISTHFLGIVDLTRASIPLAVLAGVAQFFQVRIAAKKMAVPLEKGSFAATFQQQSQYIFPAFTIFIALNLPAALPLYWLVFTLLALADDVWLKNLWAAAPASTPAVSSGEANSKQPA
ncbi:MAG: YidC/Oxa1 family membrane protein insertase [bacterium]|nr:YidC/Oxa1 family membrane protein insertase [bacterium]MDZ4296178.1 YidC/Oxa1 family membrane protein insertase [Patescibacteria group bacterium]